MFCVGCTFVFYNSTLVSYIGTLLCSQGHSLINPLFPSRRCHVCLLYYQNVSRFQTVCRGCTTVPNQILDGVWVTNEHETPTCTELPKGTVSLSSGTTVVSLTLQKGYFRTSNETSVIFECYRSEACEGGDDPGKYCANGYEGACEYRIHGKTEFFGFVLGCVIGTKFTCFRFDVSLAADVKYRPSRKGA